MDKRIPIAVFVIIFIVVVTWRLFNPPAPIPPGPLGDSSSWRSSARTGDMSTQAVNPAGTCWAGGWFKKSERSGKATYRSSLRIVPFDSNPARLISFNPPAQNGYIAGLAWIDDSTVGVLLNDNDSTTPTSSSIAVVDASTGSIKSEVKLPSAVYRVLGCIRNSGQLACVAISPEGAHLALVSADGRLDTRSQAFPLKESDSVGQSFSASPTGKFLVASINTDLPQGQVPVFYLLTTDTGASRPIFNALDLPSRVEALCVSDSGETLVVCRKGDEPHVFSVNPQQTAGPKLAPKVTDVRKRWADCPKELLFVSYKFIFSYDPATDKRTVLAELKNDTTDRESLVQQVQGGTAYRQGTDRFVTVSLVADTVDIRVFTKAGKLDRDILPRQ